MSDSTPPVTSLFSAADVPILRRDRLAVVVSQYFPDVTLSDREILGQLQAAEADLEHDLRTFFTPRLVVPDLATPAQVAAAQAANPGLPTITEPGYDYDPKLFQGESWGLIKLRHKPIGQIIRITFNYPLPTDVAYTVPAEWIRPDKKYGIINLVPVASNVALPLNAYILSVLGGGTMAPLLMQISYTCGLQNALADYPDLLNLIRSLAVCNIIENWFMPQSGSTSLDGLSGSISLDIDKKRDAIAKRIDKLRDEIHGIRLIVF
jgi:hypothetical protein